MIGRIEAYLFQLSRHSCSNILRKWSLRSWSTPFTAKIKLSSTSKVISDVPCLKIHINFIPRQLKPRNEFSAYRIIKNCFQFLYERLQYRCFGKHNPPIHRWLLCKCKHQGHGVIAGGHGLRNKLPMPLTPEVNHRVSLAHTDGTRPRGRNVSDCSQITTHDPGFCYHSFARMLTPKVDTAVIT